jgi:DNA modification methylase
MRNSSKTYRSNRATAVGHWEEVAVTLLRPAARRTRSHPSGKKRALEASIREHGVLDPVTVNASNVIVDGHLRVEIAKKLGLATLPVIKIEHLNDAELRAYAIAANKLPAVASYDLDALRLELEEIKAEVPEYDLSLTGFTLGEIDRIAGRHAATLYDDLNDEEEVDLTKPSASARGDIYALGTHRLICGDSLMPETFAAAMDGQLATCCFSDPPYNVKVNGHVSGSGMHAEFAMASGEMSREEFEAFLTSVLSNIHAHLRDGGVAFLCMDHAHLGELLTAGDAVFEERLNICVWDKGHGGMGSLYRSQHELVGVFKKGTARHINNIALGKNGRNRTNIWNFPGMAGFSKARKKALRLHPTVKPVALVAEALLDVSGVGDLVLDPFGGSGSTLIAAERTGRRACLIEYEPLYIDRTIERWERLTGKKADLIHRIDQQGSAESDPTATSPTNSFHGAELTNEQA